MSLYDDFHTLLNRAIDLHGNANKLAERLQVNSNLITRWRNKEREPLISTAQIILDIFNAELLPSKPADFEEDFRRVSANECVLKKENEELKKEIIRLKGKLEAYKRYCY